MNELKPCPFCGGEAWIDEFQQEHFNRPKLEYVWSIECKECAFSSRYHKSKDEAIEKWNTRAKQQECEKCKRIEKWYEHFGCTPTILEKYKKTIEFIRRRSRKDLDVGAEELLKELGEE